jgi:zinc/manganese transport system substrate-binding protein
VTSSRRLASVLVLAAVPALALAGCATTSASDGGDDAGITVVASTNVYGQIAEAIGGDAVSVTSLIDSGAQDPHSFEPSARDQLTVSRAELILENGGGYDPFIDSLIEASGSDAVVLTAAEFSHDWPENAGHSEDEHAEDEHDHADEGGDHAGHDHIEGFNEHVWYDPHTMSHFAEEIAHELGVLSPSDAETFDANLAEFQSGIEAIETSLADIDAAHSGAGIFVTEPVPLYLTNAAGLENLAPDAFTEAVEEGQDVPPATLVESLDLLSSGEVSLVIANAQTGGSETTQVIDDAESQAIPVVEFTETLPEGETYLSWMESNVSALSDALGA